MDGLGANLLAGAALAGDEYRCLARGGAVDDVVDRLHRQRGADKAVEMLAPVQVDEFLQILSSERVFQGDVEAVRSERLLEKVDGTCAHHVYRDIHRAM